MDVRRDRSDSNPEEEPPDPFRPGYEADMPTTDGHADGGADGGADQHPEEGADGGSDGGS